MLFFFKDLQLHHFFYNFRLIFHIITQKRRHLLTNFILLESQNLYSLYSVFSLQGHEFDPCWGRSVSHAVWQSQEKEECEEKKPYCLNQQKLKSIVVVKRNDLPY